MVLKYVGIHQPKNGNEIEAVTPKKHESIFDTSSIKETSGHNQINTKKSHILLSYNDLNDMIYYH